MPPEARAELTREMHDAGEYGVAQVHSHPFEAFHSETDNHYPLLHHRGAFSIVVPNFARKQLRDLSRTVIFRLEGVPDWYELTAAERKTCFRVLP